MTKDINDAVAEIKALHDHDAVHGKPWEESSRSPGCYGEWTPIDTQMPEPGKVYLFYLGRGSKLIIAQHTGLNGIPSAATHWMPLPEVP